MRSQEILENSSGTWENVDEDFPVVGNGRVNPKPDGVALYLRVRMREQQPVDGTGGGRSLSVEQREIRQENYNKSTVCRCCQS